MVLIRHVRMTVLLRLLVAVTVVLAFATARVEACSASGCCGDMVMSCPMLGPDGGTSTKSMCKTMCAALPAGMKTAVSGGSDGVLARGNFDLASLVVSGPEPPPPRYWRAAI